MSATMVIASPADLKVLLHIYTTNEKHPSADDGWFKELIERWKNDGIVQRRDDGILDCTENGNIWVDNILSTPQPISVWRDPREAAAQNGGKR